MSLTFCIGNLILYLIKPQSLAWSPIIVPFLSQESPSSSLASSMPTLGDSSNNNHLECVVKLASLLGSKARKVPTTYLGLPLGDPFKSPFVWDVVEKRFHKRLAFWKRVKRQYLSKGRLILFKSTLCNLPIYFMSLLVIPKMVVLRLEKIQRDFLWGRGAFEQRPHLVEWYSIFKYKKLEGLGIRVMSSFNKALFGKWC